MNSIQKPNLDHVMTRVSKVLNVNLKSVKLPHKQSKPENNRLDIFEFTGNGQNKTQRLWTREING